MIPAPTTSSIVIVLAPEIVYACVLLKSMSGGGLKFYEN